MPAADSTTTLNITALIVTPIKRMKPRQ